MSLDPKLKDAVNHLQSHAQQMQAVLDVAEAIQSIDDLERMATEAENRKGAATFNLDEIADRVKGKQAELDKAVAGIDEAKDTAKKITADARAEAKKITAKAEAEAEGIIASAKTKADVDIERGRVAVDEASSELSGIRSKVEQARRDLDGMKAEQAAAEAKRDEAKEFLRNIAAGA